MKTYVKITKLNKWFYITLLITIFWHGFIWYHSLMPGSVSSSQSEAIVDIIEPVVNVVAPNIVRDTLSLLVRKSAHFSEFFILGSLLFLLYRFKFKSYLLILLALTHGLLVAIIDETIQLFVPNRAGMFIDVLIDFTGVLVAVTVLLLIRVCFKKKTKKIKTSNSF